LPVLSRGAGEGLSPFVLVQGGGATSTHPWWFLEDRTASAAEKTAFPRDAARAVLIGLLSAAATRGADLRRVRLTLPPAV